MSGGSSLRIFVGIVLTVTGRGCPIELSPPVVAVRYGDPVQVNCSTRDLKYAWVSWEEASGAQPRRYAENGAQPRRVAHASWTLPRTASWDPAPVCYARPAPGAPAQPCSRSPKLVVYTFPQSVGLSGGGVVTAGQEATFDCELGAVAPAGRVTVLWFRGDKIVRTNIFSQKSVEPLAIRSSLSFTPNAQQQGERLWCQAHLDLDRLQLNASSPPLTLNVLFGPELLEKAGWVPEGATLRDQFVVVGNPVPLVTWLKEGRAVDPDAPLSRDDGGRYRLRAEGAALLEEELQLQVSFGPELRCPSVVEVLEAAPHQVGCSVRGRPPPEVTWSKDGEEVELPERFSRHDAGLYTVSAANSGRRVDASVELSVLYAPAVRMEVAARRVEPGGALWLKCSASGNPRPTYSWSAPRLAAVQQESEDGVSRLLIHNATAAEAGRYACHAHNRHGNHSASTTISVSRADPQCSLLLNPQRMLVPFGEAGHRASCAPAPGQAGQLAALHWEVGGATLSGDTWSADGLTDWEARPVCSASFTGPRATCQRALDLTLYKSPDDVSVRPPSSAAWLENTRVTLHCDIVNVAPAQNLTVRWYRGNQTMTSEVVESLRVTGCRPDARCLPERLKEPLNVTSTFSLTLSRELSGAQLRCEAELRLVGAQRRLRTSSAPLNVTVYYKPSIESEKQASEVPLFHGHPELLQCEADGAPPPQVRWLFAPELRPTLTARGLLVSQPGLYTCNASNAAGSASRQVEVLLKVDYLPLIAGFVAVTVVIISVIFVFIYSIYYKNTKMRRYSVKNPKLGAHQGNVAHNGWELQLPVTRLA